MSSNLVDGLLVVTESVPTDSTSHVTRNYDTTTEHGYSDYISTTLGERQESRTIQMLNKDLKTKHTTDVSIDETSTISMISAELEEVEDGKGYAKSTTEEIMVSTLYAPISTETAVYETDKTGTYTNHYNLKNSFENQQETKNANEDMHGDKYSMKEESITKKTEVFEYSTTEIVKGITDEGSLGPETESTTLGKFESDF